MPTLKFKAKGVEFEYIGEQDELVSFLNKFLSGSMALSNQAQPVTPTVAPTTTHRIDKEGMIDFSLPPMEKVLEYVTSKPDFTHDLVEIQKHFFARKFESRREGKRMYHKTRRQLSLVRKTIEEKYNGKFTETKGSKRGMKRYIFKREPIIGLLKS